MSRGDSSLRGHERGGVRLTARALVCASVLMLLAASAAAGEPRARVQLDVALVPSTLPGSEGLGYFVPEVARSFSEVLQKAGVAVAGPNELSASSAPLHVTIEERAGDRVLVVARLRSRHIEAEAAVAQIEDLVVDLAGKVVPWCVELAPAAPHTASKNGKANDVAPVAHPPAHPSTSEDTPAKTEAAAKPETAANAPAKTETTTPTIAPPVTPPPPTTVPPPPTTAPTPPLVTTPSAEDKPHKAVDPYGPDARVDVTPGDHAFIRGRVVVHTVVDPVGGYAGSGSAATQAVYAILQRRLHQSIVPMGVGLAVPAVAAEEGQRAQARTVVMGHVEGFTVVTTDPPAVRLRFELVVVREGHLVLRRTVATETPTQALFAADGHRGRAVDPVYLAVARALEGLLPELTSALASGEPR
jgi:hypothetical protein